MLGVGDNIFWAIVSFLFVIFFWLNIMEEFLSIWFGLGVALIVAYIVFYKLGQIIKKRFGE